MDSLIVSAAELAVLEEAGVTFIRSTPLPEGTFEVEFEKEDFEEAKKLLGR